MFGAVIKPAPKGIDIMEGFSIDEDIIGFIIELGLAITSGLPWKLPRRPAMDMGEFISELGKAFPKLVNRAVIKQCIVTVKHFYYPIELAIIGFISMGLNIIELPPMNGWVNIGFIPMKGPNGTIIGLFESESFSLLFLHSHKIKIELSIIANSLNCRYMVDEPESCQVLCVSFTTEMIV